MTDDMLSPDECLELCTDLGDTDSGGSLDLATCRPIEASKDLVDCYLRTCVPGRRSAGLCSDGRVETPSASGRWFASAAHLEAASAPAFERLAAALKAHGAPLELRRRAREAAADEVRHAAQMTTWARAGGASPEAPRIEPTP